MKKLFLIIVFLLIIAQKGFSQYTVTDAFPNLSFPKITELVSSYDGTNRLFAVTHTGKIYSFVNSSATSQAKLFLDISDKVYYSGELGMLGLAFHPNYESNGYFYVYYISNSPITIHLSRFKVSSNPDSAVASSEISLLQIPQAYDMHKGGKLLFGLDGYLYISLGDGDDFGNPNNTAQDLTQYNGKILRINVNFNMQSLHYSIPFSNPYFHNTRGYKEEIYAYGFRNMWKFSQDPVTGLLWGGDVGNYEKEEVDIIKRGSNYGWKIMEGDTCFSPGENCNDSGLTMPVISYRHSGFDGSCVTGGYVYRGPSLPTLYGKYIYGDYISGNIWALSNNQNLVKNVLIYHNDTSRYQLSTFGVDDKNELFFGHYMSGKIYTLGETVTGINQTGSGFVTGYKLEQNFPNPFNPSTKINFSIPKQALTTLKIYNVTGKVVSEALNETLEAGTYSYEFNAANLPSGVYYYKLETTGFSDVKKMLLVK